jgi:hypothetical protein
MDEKNIFIALLVYAFLLLFFCSLMSPLYPINDWPDVNLYFNIGKAMFHGKTLYTEVFDHKGPLIFVIYGIGYLISGQWFLGMYFIEGLAWALMLSTAYLTARLYLDKIYAFAVALVFSVFLLSHSSEGGSAEEFITLFQLLSLYLFVRYFKEKNNVIHKPSYMVIHGMMFAITLFIKLNLVVFWFFPLLAVFVNLLMHKEYKNLLRNTGAFILGVSVITLPVIFYFLINGALHYAWDTYVVLNKTYAGLGTFDRIVENLVVRFYQRLKYDNYEFVIILAGAAYFPLKYIGNKLGKAAILLSFASLYTVIFMASYYVYYYSLPYYIFSVLGCIALLALVGRFVKIQPHWYFFLLFAVIALACGIKSKSFFSRSKEIIFREKEPDDMLFNSYNIVAKEKNPTLMVLGLDASTGIFTKAGIMPNVKYFISPNLPYGIYPEMRDEQTNYIREKKVEFISLSGSSFNYDYFRALPILQENYTLVYASEKDGSKTGYFLYKRKD